MKKTFDQAVAFVLKWEGGYTYDPDDPGGETNFGITKKSYPALDIKNLTVGQARDIYYRDYWLAVNGDTLVFPLDFIAFDTAVNCGPGRANKWMSEGKNSVGLLMRRLEHYTYLVKLNPKLIRFYVGWVKRVLDLYSTVAKGGA